MAKQLEDKSLSLLLIRLNLEIQLAIKISEKMEQHFSVILAPISSKECNRKDNFYGNLI